MLVVTLETANVLLLRHNLKADLAQDSANVFLIGGYLPTAILLLVVFFPSTGFLRGWDIGAYVVLAACIGYVLRIISLVRHGAKAHRPEKNSD